MRHLKKRHKLGRGHSHRKATLASLSTALITHKRITTTLPKAKALRVFVEPLISRSKDDTTHNRRQVFRRIGDKHAVTELFNEIAGKVGERPGGYTRVVRLGQRAGDSAEMAVIELVDYNDIKPEGSGSGKKKRRTRRGRGRGGSGGGAAAATSAAAVADDVVEEVEEVAAEIDETVDEAATDAAEAVEETVDSADEAVEEATDEAEEAVEEAADEVEDVADEAEEAAEDAADESEDDEEKK